MTTSAPSVAPPPPRPPPASFEVTPAQSMMSTVPFLGSAFQTAPFMGAMTHGYGNVYDPYNRMGAFGGNFFGYNFLDNNFIRQAEESSRNAFQSIESIVGALTSVANMLNSTHTAVFSSFRAIVGVIQQIHMMRQQTYYTLLTLMHFLRMLLRRVLCWLRLRPKNYANAESVWASLTIQSQDGSASVAPSPTFNWATLFFWIVALGGPYLVYRCVSKMIRDAEDSRRWATGKMEHYTAQALYDFDASNSQELSFRAFDMLRVAPKLLQPKIRDWLLARGKSLTEFEKGKIETLHEEGFSIHYIATKIERSKDVVSRFLRDPLGYGTAKRSGRPPKLTERDKRRILRRASNTASSSATIQRETQAPVTPRQVRNIINASDQIVRARMKKAPALAEAHKARRLQFVEQNMNRDWTKVIWSDEKRFKLDGPDSFNGYWHDVRKEPLRFTTRNYGGGGLMVWAAFCGSEKVDLTFVNGRLNSVTYQQLLGEHLVPFNQLHADDGFVFMHDNAPAHRSANTTEWLAQQNIVPLPWPACSPDLNPIENVWGIMVRRIYADNKIYEDINQLRNAILAAWESIEPVTLNNLVLSMNNRVFQVINRNGNSSDY